MPTLSASDYTQYLKFKAAAASNTRGPPRMIQTVDQVAPNQSIINANLTASQAAFVVNRAQSSKTGLNYVQGNPIVTKRNNPKDLATLSFSTGGAMSSSAYRRPGGLPTGFKNSQGTYYRVPQNAGWIQGGKANQ
jgi:hypothetical protein